MKCKACGRCAWCGELLILHDEYQFNPIQVRCDVFKAGLNPDEILEDTHSPNTFDEIFAGLTSNRFA